MTSSRRDAHRSAGESRPGATRPTVDATVPSRDARAELSWPAQQRLATIVCGVDHSEQCRRALRVAAELAARLDWRLVIVT